jgi:NTP pyrophosphatase (non-canonical NTP hydrolase)
MHFNEYQVKAVVTDISLDGILKKFPSLPEEIIFILGLCYGGLGLGESGEVQNNIKKVLRDANGVITDSVREKIKGECGDLLWYIAKVLTTCDITMDEAARYNLEKLADRADRNVIKGSGDER